MHKMSLRSHLVKTSICSVSRLLKYFYSEAVIRRCSVKDVFLEILQNPQENTCARDSFTEPQACNFIKKESLAQVFSFEFCEIVKNNFFHRTPPVAASGYCLHALLLT